MNIARTLALAVLPLALGASFSSNAAEGDSATHSPATNSAPEASAKRAGTKKAGPGVPAVFLDPGPMVGHVSSSNALVWARASGAARLGMRVSSEPNLAEALDFEGPKLNAASGFMGQVEIAGLEPERRYFYCPTLDGKLAMLPPYPSFRTPPMEAQRGRVRVAFTSCVGYHGYDAAPGYSDLATRTNLDLLLMLGDNHYANTNSAVVQRQFYQDQRRTGGWRELAANLPVYAIWDDHDYGPDNSDGRLQGKEESLQTFKDHWANPSYGEPGNPGVYCKFNRAGVDFFLLDGRYHRDPNKAKNLEHKTMLGGRQVAWLQRELLASRAPIKVIACGGEFQSNGTDDSWTSFASERDGLFRFIETNRIEGVLLLSGDRHFTGAYQVRGKWIEVTAGPLGSSNAKTRNVPEMFLNFSDSKSKYYCVYDLNAASSPPEVTLEVYRVGEGLALRREFTWDEVLGLTMILPLPPSAEAPRLRRQP